MAMIIENENHCDDFQGYETVEKEEEKDDCNIEEEEMLRPGQKVLLGAETCLTETPTTMFHYDGHDDHGHHM